MLENGPQLILPHSENLIETFSEETTTRIHNDENGKIDGINSQTKSFLLNDGCDYILPDVARDLNHGNNHNCVADLAELRSQLEQKSIALEACLNELESVKQELGDAKEHINNLREQLEENANALCAYLSMGGQLS